MLEINKYVKSVKMLERRSFLSRNDIKLLLVCLSIVSGYVLNCMDFSSLSVSLKQIDLIICLFVFGVILPTVVMFMNLWSVQYRCWSLYREVSTDLNNVSLTEEDALFMHVLPHEYVGVQEIVPLQFSLFENSDVMWFFVYSKLNFQYDEAKKLFVLQNCFENKPIETIYGYVKKQGYSETEVFAATQIYGKNDCRLERPAFKTLLLKRLTSPMFVFQTFCSFLWIVDNYWYYGAFSIFMTVFFESVGVVQQLKTISIIHGLQDNKNEVFCLRNKRWILLNSDSLLPGDIVCIQSNCGSSEQLKKFTASADILLLAGTCLVDESTLTGESVPQLKEPFNFGLCADLSENFTFGNFHHAHLVCSGCDIIDHSSVVVNDSNNLGNLLSLPVDQSLQSSRNFSSSSAIGVVVSTGFSTAKGSVLRGLIDSETKSNASSSQHNWDVAFYLLFLSFFAVCAACYVWFTGKDDVNRDKYRLFVECVLILASVIPPELPIQLSLAINSAVLALFKYKIFCTESHRIEFAGQVDICCFDKTGTITEEAHIIEGVCVSDEKIFDLSSVVVNEGGDGVFLSKFILAGCHSLNKIKGADRNTFNIIGDPIEQSCFKQIKADLSVINDGQMEVNMSRVNFRILKKFPFSSKLKRMSTIVKLFSGTQNFLDKNGSFLTADQLVFLIKGDPETLYSMLDQTNESTKNYFENYNKLAVSGYRVLTLAYKKVENVDNQMSFVQKAKNEDLESNLVFCGFLVTRCPIKKGVGYVMSKLNQCNLPAVIITGDSLLTACYVAKEVGLTKRTEKFYKINQACSSLLFNDISDPANLATNEIVYNGSLPKNGKFCISGGELDKFLQNHDDGLILTLPKDIFLNIRVFARCNPQQKEMIIKVYRNEFGLSTLMVGDGTNDMGALKHCDIGIAMLNPIKLVDFNTDPNTNSSTNSNTNSNRARNKPKLLTSREPPKKGAFANMQEMQERMKKLKELKEQNPNNFNNIIDLIPDDDNELNIIKLKDASIAAPFTSKMGKIGDVLQILLQGRCTLATTLQMFRILSITALISAYSQSVHYTHGVRVGDHQLTIQVVMLMASFYFVSNTTAGEYLTLKRPRKRLFNAYMVVSILLQSLVHLVTLIVASHWAVVESNHKFTMDLDKKFEPNLINTVIYLTDIYLQTATFAVNYHGRPFMTPFFSYKSLIKSLFMSSLALVLLMTMVVPGLNEYLQLVPIPADMQWKLICSYAVNGVLVFSSDRLASLLLK